MKMLKERETNDIKIQKIEPKALSGIYEELADIIGVESTYEVYLKLHGEQRTFPQNFYKSSYVAQVVKEEFNGSNCRELARKYNYSERRIRQLINGK